MTNETHDTTADSESDSNPLQATRRNALQGAGLAGLLALGVGSASAHQDSSGSTAHQVGQQTTTGTGTVPVTWKNYTRAQSDAYFAAYVEMGGFGKFYHFRSPTPIDEQNIVKMNRDTLYSAGVFDLSQPVTITKPDTGDRYQSMQVINQDQYTKLVAYDPGEYTLTRSQVDTRYVLVGVRTFVDPTDPADIKKARQLQDEIEVRQVSPTTFEIPNWDQRSLTQLREALITVGQTMKSTRDSFGDVGEVDPVKFFLDSAVGWGGLPNSATIVLFRTPAQNDGTTPYTLTVKNVPVDAFWSVTVYNRELYMEKNKYDAYSVNNVTAERNADGRVTIHFGGDPDQKNFLYTPKGWNYAVRLYKPRKPILDGSYQFPEARPVT
jgi:hypothetical protein